MSSKRSSLRGKGGKVYGGGTKKGYVLFEDDPQHPVPVHLVRRRGQVVKTREGDRYVMVEEVQADSRATDPAAETVAHLTRSDVPTWKLVQAQLLRERLAEVKDEFGMLTSEDVAGLAGGSMKNPSSLATRWARQGKIVALKAGGGNLYPGFQFDLVTGVPYPVVADLVATWGGDDPVGLTVWCITANEWLSGARPVDLFTKSPDIVRDAIAHAVEL